MKKFTILLLLTLSTLLVMAQDKHQCAGTTKKGVQCANKTAARYCKMHDPARIKCAGTTKEGNPCQLSPSKGSDKCWRHKG